MPFAIVLRCVSAALHCFACRSFSRAYLIYQTSSVVIFVSKTMRGFVAHGRCRRFSRMFLATRCSVYVQRRDTRASLVLRLLLLGCLPLRLSTCEQLHTRGCRDERIDTPFAKASPERPCTLPHIFVACITYKTVLAKNLDERLTAFKKSLRCLREAAEALPCCCLIRAFQSAHASPAYSPRAVKMGSRKWGYGATVARLTPDQKVGSSNLSALILSKWKMQGRFLEVLLETLIWAIRQHRPCFSFKC